MNLKDKVHTEESYSVIQCNSSAEKSDDCIEVGNSSSDDYRPLNTKPSDSNLSSSSRALKQYWKNSKEYQNSLKGSW